jgi:Capsule polysaccharide biosynthesis protein
LKRSKDSITLVFVFYESIDQWAFSPIIKQIKEQSGFKVLIADGFRYDEYIKTRKISERDYPRSISRDVVEYKHSRNITDDIFLFLAKDKFSSIETRILMKNINDEVSRLESFRLKENILFVIPEDTAPLRGRLAALYASKYNIPTLALLPLYYDWITAYPLTGKRLAKHWIVSGQNMAKRLSKHGINRNSTFRQPFHPGQNNAQIISCDHHTLPAKGGFYLATLQNDNDDDAFINFLVDALELCDLEQIVIKFHPTTADPIKTDFIENYSSSKVIFTDSGPLDRLIHRSKGLIAASSTTILSAVKLNKPVILVHLNFFFSRISHLIERSKAFKTADTPSELSDILTELNIPDFKNKCLSSQKIIKKEYFEQNAVSFIEVLKTSGLAAQAINQDPSTYT